MTTPQAISEESKLQALLNLGLTIYEAKIYSVLVGRPSLTASEVSFLAHIPRPKSYGALRTLQSKGLIKILPGKPERYSPVSPEEVLVPIAEELSKGASESSKIVDILMASYQTGKTTDLEKQFQNENLWILKGRSKIYDTVTSMISESKLQLSISTTPNGIVRHYKAFCDTYEKAMVRKVKVSMISPVNQTSERVAEQLGHVIKLKHSPRSLGHFILVDGAELIVVQDNPDDWDERTGNDVAVWTRNQLLVNSVQTMYEELWRSLNSK